MPQGDAELMAEEQVLDFKPAPRLAEVDEEQCERLQEGEHRPRPCDDSTRRCDPKPDGIFGKHRYGRCCLEKCRMLVPKGARRPAYPIWHQGLSRHGAALAESSPQLRVSSALLPPSPP